jgi:hypothetical protein
MFVISAEREHDLNIARIHSDSFDLAQAQRDELASLHSALGGINKGMGIYPSQVPNLEPNPAEILDIKNDPLLGKAWDFLMKPSSRP